MADFAAGDVLIRLRADATAFQQAIQQAVRQLQQLTQVSGQVRQAQASGQQATAQSTQAMQGLTQAIQRQTQAYAQGQQAAQAVQRQQQTLTASLQTQAAATRQASTAWSAMLSVAGGIGIATSLGAIVSQMANVVRSTVEVGAQFQQLRASLANVTGGIQQGAQAFQLILETSNRYGLSLASTAQHYTRLSAATRGTLAEGELTKQLFTTLASASQTFGLTTEQTGRALLAFEQIIGKGKVSQEELRGQLGEAIPGALQIAARAYGVTTAELGKMIEKGVESTEFVRRFVTQLQSELPKGTTQVETARAAFNRLGNEIVLLKDSIARSGLLQFIASAASGMATLMQSMRQADDQRAKFMQTQVQQATGGIQMSEVDSQRALAVVEKLTQAEEELRGLQAAREQRSFGFLTPLITTDAQITKLQQRIEALRTEKTELAAVAQLRAQARQGLSARAGLEGEEDPLRAAQARQESIAAANAKLSGVLKGTKTEMDAFNKSASLAPELFGRMGASGDSALKLLDGKIKILKDSLETTTKALVEREKEPGVAPTDLLQQQQQLRKELADTEAKRQAIHDAEEARKKAARASGQEQKKEEREAEQERQKALREEAQDAAQAQAAIDQVAQRLAGQQEQAIATLQRLASAYTQTKEARDADVATALKAQFAGQEEIGLLADRVIGLAETRDAYHEELAALNERFVALKQNADAMRELEAADEAFTRKLTSSLQQVQAPRTDRRELRLRAEAAEAGVTLTHEHELTLQQITAQERLNYTLGVFENVAMSASSALTNGLTSMIERTQSVSQAFAQMGKSILQTTSQILMQEGFRTLIRLGFGVLGGALAPTTMGMTTPGGGFYQGSAGGGTPFLPPPVAFQHGGMINRPTHALIGEGPPHTLPERILNKPQWDALMHGGPGSNGSNVTIINVSNRAQAEQEAARERSLGKQVIVNEILSELSKGESSQINRMIRTLQR